MPETPDGEVGVPIVDLTVLVAQLNESLWSLRADAVMLDIAARDARTTADQTEALLNLLNGDHVTRVVPSTT